MPTSLPPVEQHQYGLYTSIDLDYTIRDESGIARDVSGMVHRMLLKADPSQDDTLALAEFAITMRAGTGEVNALLTPAAQRAAGLRAETYYADHRVRSGDNEWIVYRLELRLSQPVTQSAP